MCVCVFVSVCLLVSLWYSTCFPVCLLFSLHPNCESRFKLALIDSLGPDAILSLYRCGDFVDLCRGPHLPHTGIIKVVAAHACERMWGSGVDVCVCVCVCCVRMCVCVLACVRASGGFVCVCVCVCARA
ncbi:MAG: hypothetical protein P4L40_23160 [Terracidiphilus sp.]|nr:hypothetical protein [Terracidiphilus sp.]